MATTTYKVIEVGQTKQGRQSKELYKGPSRAEAIEKYKEPQSLMLSHKRLYEGRKRLYPYEF